MAGLLLAIHVLGCHEPWMPGTKAGHDEQWLQMALILLAAFSVREVLIGGEC
jgi:hypothetical protein